MLMGGKPSKIEIFQDNELFVKVKNKAEVFYKSINKVFCPYFRDSINFNTAGLDHIKFKQWSKPRTIADQYMRLKLLHLAPEVITRSNTVQGVWRKKEWVRIKKHGKWEKRPLDVADYEFVAVIGKVRIKIVVKEIIGGEKFFWSIIPFWSMNEITKQKKLHYGDLERDSNITENIDLENDTTKNTSSAGTL